MNLVRSFALLVAVVALLATSCSSTAELGVAPEVSAEIVEPEAGSPETEPGKAEPQEVATTHPLGNASFEVGTAEELDRVAIVGLAPEISADEVIVFTMFQGHEVAFPVYEDQAGLHIYAPLNPADPGNDGQIEFRLTNGTDVGPPMSLALTGLPPAPGAAEEYAAEARDRVEALANDAGTTFSELQAMPIDAVGDELISIKIMQQLVDDGTENDLTSALSADESGLGGQDMALLDSMVAKMERTSQAQQLPPQGAPPVPPVPPAPPAPEVPPAPPGGPGTSGSASCLPNPLQINSGGDLAKYLKLGVDANVAIGGEAAVLDKQAATAFGFGSLTPRIGFVSGGLSLLITTGSVRTKIAAGRYPSSVSDFTATVSPKDFDADFKEGGTWSDVYVTAHATGYDARRDILAVAVKAATLPLGVAKLLAKGPARPFEVAEEIGSLATKAGTKVGQKVAVEVLQKLTAGGFNYCPRDWTVMVTGDPYTTVRSTKGRLAIDPLARTFSPTEVGPDELEIKLNTSLFPGQGLSNIYPITTHATTLALAPGKIVVQNPGELVEIGITFENSETQKANWETSAGFFAFLEGETTGPATVELVTPDSADDYPVTVRATFSGKSGLFALTPAPPNPTDFVIIELADVVITPPDARVATGGRVQYFATDRDGAPVEVDWSAGGGSISIDGLFSAGDQEGVHAVTARLKGRPQVTATVPVTIFEPDCVVGTWSLRAAPFLAAITSLADSSGTWSYVSGEYLVTLAEDGTFRNQRVALTSEITFEGQTLVLEIDSTESGTYIDDGTTLTLDETESNAVVEMVLPGFGRTAAPVSAPNGLSGKGAYTCGDGVLTVTVDGITATLDYLGEPS